MEGQEGEASIEFGRLSAETERLKEEVKKRDS